MLSFAEFRDLAKSIESRTRHRRGVRTFLALLLVFAIFASGCTRDRVNPYEPALQDNTGSLRVVVQDNHNARVANATVLILPWGESGTTDDVGIVVFSGLAPGNGTVQVNAQGYYDSQKPARVVAHDNREVPVIIDRK